MQRVIQYLSVLLVFAALLTACGSGARRRTEPVVYPATDYLEFTDYPQDGRHWNRVGERELRDTGFSLRVSTHAELDYTVGGDQLGKMSEALGGQLMQAYSWRLENRYTFDTVELESETMEELLGVSIPAYHATFVMTQDGITSKSDFYCFAFDRSLCTLEFVYEDNKTNTDRVQQIVKGMRVRDTYNMPPADYGFDWEDTYTVPTYVTGSTDPIQGAGPSGYRIDGKLYGELPEEGVSIQQLQLYDYAGQCWIVKGDKALLAEAVDGLLASSGGRSLEGIPVTVFGNLNTVQAPPDPEDEDSAAANPLEGGFTFQMRAQYLVASEQETLYKLA